MSDESPLVLHEWMSQKIRRGTWRDHCKSTYDLFAEHLNAGRFEGAAELARYTLQEAQEAVDLYLIWLRQTREFMAEKGVDMGAAAEDERALLASLANADGTPFDPVGGWGRVCADANEAAAWCSALEGDKAIASLEASRTGWLDTHDRLCDWVQGVIAILAKHAGEETIGALWQRLMGPMFETYERYDIDRTPWEVSAERLLQVTAEALRGHLSGPGRRGSLDVIEEEDRIGFRFAPCGSGGRNFTGETHGAYPLTTQEHDWAWNTKGVCLYCAHCCALSELNPISRFGYPARVVEPPYTNESGSRRHCTWWIYRSPELVPDEAYRRTGHSKPAALGGHATRAAQA